ncbi:MAG: type IV pilus twitching motility protein PilT [Sporichthyaceae bacterium]
MADQLDALLADLWLAGGTDLHLTAGVAPLGRIEGALRPLAERPLAPEDTEQHARVLVSEGQWKLFESGQDLDFAFDWRQDARIRGNVFRQRGATAIAMRMIPRQIPSLEALGVPPVMQRFADLGQGLVLVSGPTGSGKSTTLASLIDAINARRAVHVLTIEDPIEYVHSHRVAAVNQREVGTDTPSFGAALRSALREDPDVILVGEMRDLESIRFTLTLAETGHLVFATLHTNDTAQAVDRMIDVFPGDQQEQIRVQLASTLTGIVFQRLVPRIGGGLAAAYEVLLANQAVRNLIKEARPNQLRNQIITSSREGMQTLESSLDALVRDGVVSYEDAIARANFPRDIARHA